jgi:CheY-like chemotaxis protein
MTVDVAYNGLTALEKVEKKQAQGIAPYKAILMDFEMPIMDGRESSIRIKGLIPKQIVIGITAVNEAQAIEAEGFDKVLPKPVDLGDLKS